MAIEPDSFVRRKRNLNHTRKRTDRLPPSSSSQVAALIDSSAGPGGAARPIRAELLGSSQCTAAGITVRGNAPVLALCRRLVAAGHDPATPLRVYRGDVLALVVRSIGEGARLRTTTGRTGAPVFIAEKSIAAAPPVEKSETALWHDWPAAMGEVAP